MIFRQHHNVIFENKRSQTRRRSAYAPEPVHIRVQLRVDTLPKPGFTGSQNRPFRSEPGRGFVFIRLAAERLILIRFQQVSDVQMQMGRYITAALLMTIYSEDLHRIDIL